MANRQKPPTDAKLINLLGGNTIVADLLTKEMGEKVEPGAVAQMKHKQKISDYLRPTFARLLINAGITPPSTFMRVKPRRRRASVA